LSHQQRASGGKVNLEERPRIKKTTGKNCLNKKFFRPRRENELKEGLPEINWLLKSSSWGFSPKKKKGKVREERKTTGGDHENILPSPRKMIGGPGKGA